MASCVDKGDLLQLGTYLYDACVKVALNSIVCEQQRLPHGNDLSEQVSDNPLGCGTGGGRSNLLVVVAEPDPASALYTLW